MKHNRQSTCSDQSSCADNNNAAEKIFKDYKNAVVEVKAEFILLGADDTGAPLTSATGGTPLGADLRQDIILEGNGFFIKKHYIVTPAHLVLMPPSLTSIVNRFPLPDPADLTLGNIRNVMVRASRILVTVFNVNNEGPSFEYEADLVGVDGAGDIAVLKINCARQWNICNPPIKRDCHPYFEFKDSRQCREGEPIYMIGDYITNNLNRRVFNAAGAICEGILSDKRYVDYTGWNLAECVLVSAPAYAFSSGLPIINACGQVIGMQTTDLIVTPQQQLIFGATGAAVPQAEGSGYVAGPSTFFMKRIIGKLVKGRQSCDAQCNMQVISVLDPAGAYTVYRKGYLGLAYEVFTGKDYDITTDFTSGGVNSGQPRIRLSPTGEFLSTPSCKEIVGIKVLGIAGANPDDLTGIANGYYYVPGGTTTVAPFLDQEIAPSGFLGRIFPGDVITHIDGIPLGDLHDGSSKDKEHCYKKKKCTSCRGQCDGECGNLCNGKYMQQVAPSAILWRLCAGDNVEIAYRQGGNALNTADNGVMAPNYDNQKYFTGLVQERPSLMDYPWYAVNVFPLLSPMGWTFTGQLVNPQVPQSDVVGAGIFHPAI